MRKKLNHQNPKNLKSYVIITHGCAMNMADTERFRTILNMYGLQEVKDREDADIIVFNTCSVRQKAEDRIYGLKREIEKLRNKPKTHQSSPKLRLTSTPKPTTQNPLPITQNPLPITILTGCMARRKFKDDVKRNTKTEKTNISREAEIKQRADWLDIVIETKEFAKVGQHLKKIGVKLEIDESIESEIFNKQEKSEFLDVTRTPSTAVTANITISHGCDHMCSFCIVPYARGHEVAREFEPIKKEVEHAIETGVKDIMLLGQTVNRWINPKFRDEFIDTDRILTRIPKLNVHPLEDAKAEPKDFLQLMQYIDNLKGDFWFSFISSHPNYMTDKLIKLIGSSVKNNGHIRPYVHFALQSGSNEILKKMRRNHEIEEFIEKVELMREVIPEVAVTTDIIVGFPSETEEQFEDTLFVCKELEFDQIYISEYSEREGTGSSFMKDNVSHEVKETRKTRINDVLREGARKRNKLLRGTKQKVLVAKKKKDGKYMGRTGHNKLVEIESEGLDLTIGEFVKVKVTSSTPWALSGYPAV